MVAHHQTTPALPQTQPAVPDQRRDRPRRLRQLERVGDLDGPERRPSPASTSPTWCATTPAATARSRSSCATTRATPTCCSRPPTRPGRPTTYGGNSLYNCTSAARRTPPTATRPRSRSPTTGRSTPDRHQRRSGLPHLGRVPDDPLPRGERLRRQLHAGRRHATAAAPCCCNHKVFMSTGHDEYWSGPQRANVEAARDAGVNLAFFSGNEMFWKTRWEPSIDGTNTSYRTLVCYKETHCQRRRPTRRRPWTGTWRDPRFSPPPDGGRPENALTGHDRSSVNSGSTTRSPCRRPYEQAALLAQHRRRDASPPGTTAHAGARRRSATSGTRTSTTASGPRACSTSRRPRVPDVADVHRLRDVHRAERDGDAQPDAVPGAERRARVRRRHRPVVVGPRRANPRRQPDRRPRSTCSRRRSTCSPTWAPSRGRSLTGLIRAATVDRHHRPDRDDHLAGRRGSTSPTAAMVTITGTAADTGGGVVAGVEVSTDGGSTWHPATGTTSVDLQLDRCTARRPRTIRVRATDDSGNLQPPAPAAYRSTSHCPCSIWGDVVHPGAAPTPATPARSSSA